MRERRRRFRDEDGTALGARGPRPRANQLSDEAIPNVLTGTGEAASRNAVPSWIRAAAGGGAAPARQARRLQAAAPRQEAAPRSEEAEVRQSTPSLFTIVIAAFIVISILRACLQLG